MVSSRTVSSRLLTSSYSRSSRTLVGQFDFKRPRELIQTSPDVMRKDVAYDIMVGASQEAYALAYRGPYWISIAFGAVTYVLAFFLRDIKKFMSMEVAVEQQQRVEGDELQSVEEWRVS
jgi:hypothetical protein